MCKCYLDLTFRVHPCRSHTTPILTVAPLFSLLLKIYFVMVAKSLHDFLGRPKPLYYVGLTSKPHCISAKTVAGNVTSLTRMVNHAYMLKQALSFTRKTVILSTVLLMLSVTRARFDHKVYSYKYYYVHIILKLVISLLYSTFPKLIISYLGYSYLDYFLS